MISRGLPNNVTALVSDRALEFDFPFAEINGLFAVFKTSLLADVSLPTVMGS